MRNSFINKVTRVHKVLTVANSVSLCSTLLAVFLEFNLVDRAEIDPLQFTIKWYENRHAEEQTAHWDIQNKAT